MKRNLIFIFLTSFLFAGRVQVCLDPGHGGQDPGTINPRFGQNGPYEKDFNLYIAQVCEADLVWGLGYTVSMTRVGDDRVSLERRWKMANGLIPNPYSGRCDTADIFVSIHNNGAKSRASRGTETWYWADSLLAHHVQSGMFYYISNLPYAQNRGLKERSYEVIRKVDCPACLIEGAFVTHDTFSNGQWFQLKDNQGSIKDKIGWGIDNGINSYYTFGPKPSLRIDPSLGRPVSIKIGWSSISGVTGYNIYRRVSLSGNFIQIAANVSGTTYSDTAISPGIFYSYYVRGRRSNGQQGVRSNIATAQSAPYSSNLSMATGLNTGRKSWFTSDGICHLTFASLENIWWSFSPNYGTNWSTTQVIDYGWHSIIGANSQSLINLCYIGNMGIPDSAAQETLKYTINHACRLENIWYNSPIYETYDSILSVSFVIDPLDTGWVVFNTLWSRF